MFAGSDSDPEWLAIKQKMHDWFQWQDWETDEFVQCGVRIRQAPDSSFTLDQEDYVVGIKEIDISKERRRDPKTETTNYEKHCLRALLGAISWHAQQVGAQHAAGVSSYSPR
jgi:hypothetical protein